MAGLLSANVSSTELNLAVIVMAFSNGSLDVRSNIVPVEQYSLASAGMSPMLNGSYVSWLVEPNVPASMSIVTSPCGDNNWAATSGATNTATDSVGSITNSLPEELENTPAAAKPPAMAPINTTKPRPASIVYRFCSGARLGVGQNLAQGDWSGLVDGKLLDPRLADKPRSRSVRQPNIIVVFAFLLPYDLPHQIALRVGGAVEILVAPGVFDGPNSGLVQ